MLTLRWLGHSAVELIAGGKKIFIDPFLTDNPKSPLKGAEVVEADVVCVTHDHHDHLGDSVDICRRTGAAFVGVYELGLHAESEGVKEVVAMNVGGSAEVRGVGVTMVPAVHSSTRGPPVGFVVHAGGVSVYHAGDTALFSDMRIIGRLHQPDVACLPVGGFYTMGPREAAEAAELLTPRAVLPMHYMTFPVLAQSADEFIDAMRGKGLGERVLVLRPGEAHDFGSQTQL